MNSKGLRNTWGPREKIEGEDELKSRLYREKAWMVRKCLLGLRGPAAVHHRWETLFCGTDGPVLGRQLLGHFWDLHRICFCSLMGGWMLMDVCYTDFWHSPCVGPQRSKPEPERAVLPLAVSLECLLLVKPGASCQGETLTGSISITSEGTEGGAGAERQ